MNNEQFTNKQPSIKAQKIVTFLSHLLGVSIIFILPDVLMSRSISHFGGAPWLVYAKSIMFVVLFYINYYFVIDKCLSRKNWVLKVSAWNLLFIALIIVLLYLIREADGSQPPHDDTKNQFLLHLSFVARDIVMMVMTIALSVAVKIAQRWMKLRDTHRQLISAQQAQELESLKSQLNPHFLFNTLNALYALISVCPEKAQEAVHQLSSLLRYVLYENSQTVRVADELKFIDNYVKLMKLRLGDSITINTTLDAGNCANLQIAPLIFISPVENAFKHGNTGNPDAQIDIAIICHDNVINCMIVNSYNANRVNADANSGIGIQNLRKRLELIYGDSATIHTDLSNSTYCFTMIIDLTHQS
jgi:two-component sensor histidine kinase